MECKVFHFEEIYVLCHPNFQVLVAVQVLVSACRQIRQHDNGWTHTWNMTVIIPMLVSFSETGLMAFRELLQMGMCSIIVHFQEDPSWDLQT